MALSKPVSLRFNYHMTIMKIIPPYFPNLKCPTMPQHSANTVCSSQKWLVLELSSVMPGFGDFVGCKNWGKRLTEGRRVFPIKQTFCTGSQPTELSLLPLLAAPHTISLPASRLAAHITPGSALWYLSAPRWSTAWKPLPSKVVVRITTRQFMERMKELNKC